MKRTHINPVFLIFTIFFLLVLFQHQFMFLYHDDYGYASLSYHYVVSGHAGHSFSLPDTIEFLRGHYQIWGGRVLFLFVDIVLLSIGLPFFRIVQSLVILGIFLLIYRIVIIYVDTNKLIVPIMCCSMYGFIQQSAFKSGIFWATASVLYLFPILFLLLFLYLKLSKKDFRIKKALMIFSAFVAAFSQEQTAAACFGMCLAFVAADYIRFKKASLINLLCLLGSAAGFCILILAPGNKVRMEWSDFYRLSLTSKIRLGLQHLLEAIYSRENGIAVILLIFVSVISAVSVLNKNDKSAKTGIIRILTYSSIASNAMILAGYAIVDKGNYCRCLSELFGAGVSDIFIYCLVTWQTLLLCVPVITYLFINKHHLLGTLFIMAIGTQMMMTVTSYYPMRSFLIFSFILFLIALVVILENIKGNGIKCCAIICLCIFAVNYGYITTGYASNYDENTFNEQQLTEAANAEAGDVIHLVKLENDRFAGEMPYQENFEYIIDHWFYNYYSIPKGVIIQYD